jgi:xylulokinase
MGYLLGIDLGTSSVKTALVDIYGKILAVASEEYSIEIPCQGFAEQNPEVWWKAAVNTIRAVLVKSGISSDEIKSIGLSGQMHGTVVINKDLQPLRPAIIWCDQRTVSQVQKIYTQVGMERLGEITLNPVAVGFQVASMLWIRENEPEIYNNIYKVILPKDYIRLKLTGKVGTDITDASSTLSFDTKKLEWSEDIIDATGLDIDKYPEVGLPYSIAGEVTGSAETETGLKKGTLVVYGGGDQPMQAVGNGIVEPGLVSSTIGTGGQIFTLAQEPIYDRKLRTHTFSNAVPNTWNILGASLCAGLSLRWLRENIIAKTRYDELDKAAELLPPGSEGLVFLPYLTGERTPHMDPHARGVFFGLSLKHNYVHMARAVMEGVVFALLDSLNIFKGLGIPMNKVIASGGGARSKLWLQMQADIFNMEVYTTKSVEQACLGAAIMAGIGCGIYSDVVQACKVAVKINDEPIVPIEDNVRKYRHFYNIFGELYSCNKHLFQQISSEQF